MNSYTFFKMLLLFSLSFLSCKKYLDVKPSTYLAVPNSDVDFLALLDNAEVMNLGSPRGTSAFGAFSSDDYFLIPTAINSMAEEVVQGYTYRRSDIFFGYPVTDWKIVYSPIYYANLCLEGLNENSKLHNQIKGSALFFRAYYHLSLLWDYGKAYHSVDSKKDLGIILRTSTKNITLPRSTVEECYKQILEDLHEAAELLPDVPSHVMRPSKAACFALLARTCLSMRDYENALNFATECLKIKSNLLDFKQITFSGNTPFAQYAYSWNPGEVIFYSEMNKASLGVYLAGSNARVDTTIFESYSTTDIRKTAFFKASGGYHQFIGSYAGRSAFLFSGLATDEIYLIKAECLARKGLKDSSLNVLNTFLKHRHNDNFTPLTFGSEDEVLQAILQERRKELLYRGIRWSDIKRLNLEGFNISLHRKIGNETYTLLPNSNYFALPLPRDLIELTGVTDNPE